jgi:hypothetical protein
MRLHIAYIAGFLDGDGSISARLVKQHSGDHFAPAFVPIVGFFNQNYGVLADIQETIACGQIVAYNTSSMGSGCYRLMVPLSQIRRVLEMILPYLRVKQTQAQLVLAGLDTRQRGSSRITGEVQLLRETICQQVSALNKADGKAYRTKWVNSVDHSPAVMSVESIPSQSSVGEDSEAGVTTSSVSPNNNRSHEDPPRKGLYSLTSVATQRSA